MGAASAYLFDIGKVILYFDFGRTVAAISDKCEAVPADQLMPAVIDLTTRLELGEIQPDDFVDRVSERVGFTGTKEEFLSAFQNVFDLNEPMVEFIEQLDEAGMPLFLLSNTSKIHVSFFTKAYPVFSRFSGAVYSYEEHCMKPDEKIYQAAINRFSLVPEETVYIDDLADNCEAAEELGFRSVCYDRENHENFLRQIEKNSVDLSANL